MGLEKGVVGKIALRWKEEMPKIFTSCGENYNYSIDKTGDQIWAGVFEKDKPNEAVRCSTFADEKAAREFCKKIEADGKLPLCMGRGAAKETITLPEYGKELQDISGSGKLPKKANKKVAYTVDQSVANAVVDWLKREVLYDYDHQQALDDYSDRWWELVKEALDYDLYDAVYDILESQGIENEKFSALEDVPTPQNIIRDLIIDEQDAIQGYENAITAIEDESIKAGLNEIKNEEKAHVGELQKWLEYIDPSEKQDFEDGQAEVTEEEMKRESSLKKKANALSKVAASAYDLANDIVRDLESDGPFETEDDVYEYINDEIDNGLIYTDDIYDYAKDYVDSSEILNMFIEEFTDDVYSNIGDLSRFVENEDANEYAASRRNAYRRRITKKVSRKVARKIDFQCKKKSHSKKADANLAPSVSRHDESNPFYAYYEGDTKDKKASITVSQIDLGSKPRLVVCSNQGKIIDFGLFPNMQYAMKQASVFEKLNFDAVAAMAPTPLTRVTTAAKEAQYQGEWIDDEDGTGAYKDVGELSNVYVMFTGWSNDRSFGSTGEYIGCYSWFDGIMDNQHEHTTICKVKTVDTEALSIQERNSLSYAEMLQKYNNPQDGFASYQEAVEYCKQKTDEWLSQNMSRIASKTKKHAQVDWEEQSGVWAAFVEPFEIEIDYDYYVPGKYHWEVADMSQSLAGKVVADGSCDTLEQAQKEALDYID